MQRYNKQKSLFLANVNWICGLIESGFLMALRCALSQNYYTKLVFVFSGIVARHLVL